MPPNAPTPQAAFWLSLLSLLFCATLGAMVAAWTWAIGRWRSGRPLLPEPKPRVVPWGTGTVLLVFFAWLAVNIIVSVGYLKLAGVGKARRMPTPTEQMAVVSLINLILLAVIPAILRLTGRAKLADLGIELRGLGRQALAGAVGFLLIAPLVYTLNGLAVLVFEQNKHPLEQMVVAEPTAGIACLAFLSAVVLAPAAEELIFRGIIQSWLTKLFRPSEVDEELDVAVGPDSTPGVPGDLTPDPPEGGIFAVSVPLAVSEGEVDSPADRTRPSEEARVAPPETVLGPPAEMPVESRQAGRRGPAIRRWLRSQAPILITSAVFAAVHLPQWPAPLAIFFLSIGLGVVYQRTGSLIASFVMHALFNGFGTMMLFAAILAGKGGVNPKALPTATCSTTTPEVPEEGHPPMLRQPISRP
ncbi:MAG: hypothetical protein QOE66_209 [Chloroflexota bacterium]|nr:hypothetical protein [Chloroflexota bacterium]